MGEDDYWTNLEEDLRVGIQSPTWRIVSFQGQERLNTVRELVPSLVSLLAAVSLTSYASAVLAGGC